MEEIREQPIIMPATALNQAEEKNESAMSEVGSLEDGELGKFKSVQALMDAYNSLQAEFTKKCQALSQLKKDKTEAGDKEDFVAEEKPEDEAKEEISQNALTEEDFNQFLSENGDAREYAEEIKEKVSSCTQNISPYEVAWAQILLGNLKEQNEKSDNIINQYVLSNENVKNKIIENYLKELSSTRSPMVISSQSGERVSGIIPDTPKTLKEAKKLVNKMFS